MTTFNLSGRISDELVRTAKQYKETDMQTLGMITSMLACAREVSERCIDVHYIENYCQDNLQKLIAGVTLIMQRADNENIAYYEGMIDGYDLARVIAMFIVDEYYQELLKK